MRQLALILGLLLTGCVTARQKAAGPEGPTDRLRWRIDTMEEWRDAAKQTGGIVFTNGMAVPTTASSSYSSIVRRFNTRRSARSITFEQSPVWHNWEPIENIGPSNLGDAPVLLALGPDNYWMFGRYRAAKRRDFSAEYATLEGFDVPLTTTPYPNQFNAPGGLKPGLGGYHAWQSRDMVNWVHHGPVTKKVSCWVTTAEYANGEVYIYYDYPNDQDPHLYIDNDLTDGEPGRNIGLAFRDPSHGSDCTFIRDLEGNFHVIYEDWTPINARRHSWDSPLAGHAVSRNGRGRFKILAPAVDERTTPTGEVAQYLHPHWKQHPRWDSNVGKYDVHEPEQNAFGDWAAISVGGQYYLFCDYHPANDKIRVGWFTSDGLDKPFTRCGEIGRGHPDPDIIFAEGKFYLVTQMKTDYTSPGPWVEKVEARVGVDTNGDGKINTWTDWQEVKESYDYIPGFAKQIKRTPASIDLGALPPGFGFAFGIRTEDSTTNHSKPVLESVTILFEENTR